jgi:hypothetical protein
MPIAYINGNETLVRKATLQELVDLSEWAFADTLKAIKAMDGIDSPEQRERRLNEALALRNTGDALVRWLGGPVAVLRVLNLVLPDQVEQLTTADGDPLNAYELHCLALEVVNIVAAPSSKKKAMKPTPK